MNFGSFIIVVVICGGGGSLGHKKLLNMRFYIFGLFDLQFGGARSFHFYDFFCQGTAYVSKYKFNFFRYFFLKPDFIIFFLIKFFLPSSMPQCLRREPVLVDERLEFKLEFKFNILNLNSNFFVKPQYLAEK